MEHFGRAVLAATALLWLVPCGEAEGTAVTYQWDQNGYILYCPCMGRFGNQAAHFLGSLAFAKALNRTLAIPPWRSHAHQKNIPYSDFFQVEPVTHYHRALPLEHFMTHLAPTYWPPGNRTGYCYGPSPHSENKEDCEMKYGNPFGPFWDAFSVDFDGSIFTKMSYQIGHKMFLDRWHERYPPSSHPVLAFKGAPASFPVLPEHRPLQRYVRWSKRMESEATSYINHTFGVDTPYIGVHLRMGVDWERACESAQGKERFMESVQCLDELPGAQISQDLCLPPLDFVVRYLVALTRRLRVYTVFVASDVEGEKHGLQQLLGRKIKTYYLSPKFPQLDLILLAKSKFFVGNCISSFSAFVKRERDVRNRPSDFFGLAEIKESYVLKEKNRTEL